MVLYLFIVMLLAEQDKSSIMYLGCFFTTTTTVYLLEVWYLLNKNVQTEIR